MKSDKRFKNIRCKPPLSNPLANAHDTEAERYQSVDVQAPSINTYGTSAATVVNAATVDRQAQIDLDRRKKDPKESFVGPRTASEKLMASVWAEILKLKEISVHDNFFDHGHDSFLAMEVIIRVRKVFAVKLSVRALFEDPTVAGMTAAVLRSQYKHHDKPALLDRASESWARNKGTQQLLSKHK